MRVQTSNVLSSMWSDNSKVIDELDLWQDLNEALLSFPPENREIMQGVKWGLCYQLYTPAFWKLQYLLNECQISPQQHQLGSTIIEEVVLCILGGYGIPSEMGILAFEQLKRDDLVRPKVSIDELVEVLNAPISVDGDRQVKYRFANQKAKYIHDFLNRDDLEIIPENDDLKLRKWLLDIKGIGLKTASWITRNWLHSERVAILDIHLLRAGILTGFFDRDQRVETEYYDLERQYLMFCGLIEVLPSIMDAIIWNYMKRNNKLALTILSSIT